MKPKEALDLLTDKLLAYGPSKAKVKKTKKKAKKKKAP
jgi:hypothetical protein